MFSMFGQIWGRSDGQSYDVDMASSGRGLPRSSQTINYFITQNPPDPFQAVFFFKKCKFTCRKSTQFQRKFTEIQSEAPTSSLPPPPSACRKRLWVILFGFLLIYPFVAISIGAIAYLFMLPVSYFHYKKLKKQNDDKDLADDDFEDII